MRMKRRTREERQKLIGIFRSSGMSPSVFCRKHGMHFTTLYGWMRELGVKVKGRHGFKRLEISPFIGLGEPVVAEITLPNGTGVRVMRGCAEDELAIILDRVRQPSEGK